MRGALTDSLRRISFQRMSSVSEGFAKPQVVEDGQEVSKKKAA
jgi:hypothetical protein